MICSGLAFEFGAPPQLRNGLPLAVVLAVAWIRLGHPGAAAATCLFNGEFEREPAPSPFDPVRTYAPLGTS